MNSETTIRAAAIYVPLIGATFAGLARPRRPRQFAACLLSLLWTFPTLLIIQYLNRSVALFAWSHGLAPSSLALDVARQPSYVFTSWWSFAPSHPSILSMPIELYIGWAILWGLLPQLALSDIDPPEAAIVMGFLDLWIMPYCRPVVQFSSDWPVGEVAVLLLVLVPALYIYRWTLNDTHLNFRATLQVVLSGLIFLFLLPEIAFAARSGFGWSPLLKMPGWERQLGIQILLILALPGVSAVMEFAQRGRGTPIPYDPPRRLVTSGIYRYVSNPMQLSCGLVMLLWAAMLHNIWVVLAACTSILYSAGIAEWDEGEDLYARFHAWKHYRASVRSWRIRWRPFHLGRPACLYIASTCGPCSELRTWLEARHPLGLTLIDAETLSAGSIRRLRYDPSDGTSPVDGVRAFARALEHLNFGWTLCGAALRMPILWQSIQLLMDASGLGPRRLGRSRPTEQ